MRDQQALTSADANLTLEQTEQRRQLGRLRRIADDPTWSPVLRMYAKRLAYEGGVLTDDDIRAVLVDRINRRAATPGTPDDPAALRARFGNRAPHLKGQSMPDSQPTTDTNDSHRPPGPTIADRYGNATPARETAGRRAAVIAGIRALAQMLEDHPDLPLPYSVRAQAGLTRNETTWDQQRATVTDAAELIGRPLYCDEEDRAEAVVQLAGYDVEYRVVAIREDQPAEANTDG